MSVASMLRQTCSVSRMARTGTNGRGGMAVLHTGVKCQRFPMSAQTAIANNFELNRAFDFFFILGTDVKIGDELAIGTNTYTVRFIQTYDQSAGGNHILAMCEQEVA